MQDLKHLEWSKRRCSEGANWLMAETLKNQLFDMELFCQIGVSYKWLNCSELGIFGLQNVWLVVFRNLCVDSKTLPSFVVGNVSQCRTELCCNVRPCGEWIIAIDGSDVFHVIVSRPARYQQNVRYAITLFNIAMTIWLAINKKNI